MYMFYQTPYSSLCQNSGNFIVLFLTWGAVVQSSLDSPLYSCCLGVTITSVGPLLSYVCVLVWMTKHMGTLSLTWIWISHQLGLTPPGSFQLCLYIAIWIWINYQVSLFFSMFIKIMGLYKQVSTSSLALTLTSSVSHINHITATTIWGVHFFLRARWGS